MNIHINFSILPATHSFQNKVLTAHLGHSHPHLYGCPTQEGTCLLSTELARCTVTNQLHIRGAFSFPADEGEKGTTNAPRICTEFAHEITPVLDSKVW